MIKILYLAHSADVSGSSIALCNIIKYISKSASVAVVLPCHGELSNQLEKEEIICYYLKYSMNIYPKVNSLYAFFKYPLTLLKRILTNQIAQLYLEKIVCSFSPNIIHTNVGPLCIGYEIARKYKIPHVWHIREYQDLDFSMHPFPSMSIYRKKLHNRNNSLIAITDGVFSHFNMADNATVIYDGVVDENNIISANVDKKDYFLFVGKVGKSKGVKELINSFVVFSKKNRITKLLIAGTGDDAYINECKQIVVDANLIDRVDFLGFRKDVYSLMSRAKALIVPSRFEGFGFITTEAMLNHCLVVGKNTAGTKEQFDNGLKIYGDEIGIRFDSFDELPNILNEIAERSNVSYKDILDRAYSTVLKLYSVDTQMKKLQSFYDKIYK